MIDLHCHILPGMDDGSPNTEESVAMLRVAQKNKINVIFATPHFIDYDKIEEFVMERDAKAVSLNEKAEALGLSPRIACGSELFLDSRIFTADSLDELTLNGSKYMLCEFTLKPFNNDRAIIYTEELIARGYVPIIAHPERYINFLREPEIVNELWDMGCRFQVNASGLAGHGGAQMQEFSCELVKRGFTVSIASDAHSSTVRNNRLLEKLGQFPDELTREELDDQLTNFPLMILKKEELPKREVEYF